MCKSAPVPGEQKKMMPEKKQQRVVRMLTNNLNQLNWERKEKEAAFDLGCSKEWKWRDDIGEAATTDNV